MVCSCDRASLARALARHKYAGRKTFCPIASRSLTKQRYQDTAKSPGLLTFSVASLPSLVQPDSGLLVCLTSIRTAAKVVCTHLDDLTIQTPAETGTDMANLFCNGGTSASKPISLVSTADRSNASPPLIIDGLVQHETLTPETQIQIFSLIDEQGWCTVGDVIASLPDHPRPVTALGALAAAGVIELHVDRLIDEHTRLTRAAFSEAPDGTGTVSPAGDGGADHSGGHDLPQGVKTLATGEFVPVIHHVAGSNRNALLGVADLDRAGVYWPPGRGGSMWA